MNVQELQDKIEVNEKSRKYKLDQFCKTCERTEYNIKMINENCKRAKELLSRV